MDAMTIEDYNESVCGLAREKVEPFDSVSDAAGFLQGEVSSGRRGWDVVRREVSLSKSWTAEAVPNSRRSSTQTPSCQMKHWSQRVEICIPHWR